MRRQGMATLLAWAGLALAPAVGWAQSPATPPGPTGGLGVGGPAGVTPGSVGSTGP